MTEKLVKKEKAEVKTLTIRMAPELHAEFKEFAKGLKEPMNGLVIKAIKGILGKTEEVTEEAEPVKAEGTE